jgi:DnaJ-class molecular chaperone
VSLEADRTDESLTLDVGARERATAALQDALEHGHRTHYCAEWTEDGTCTICWQVAADVIRAAEGLRLCATCRGTGQPGPEGDACSDCSGNGLDTLESPA